MLQFSAGVVPRVFDCLVLWCCCVGMRETCVCVCASQRDDPIRSTPVAFCGMALIARCEVRLSHSPMNERDVSYYCMHCMHPHFVSVSVWLF